jgi:hypothetical protein
LSCVSCLAARWGELAAALAHSPSIPLHSPLPPCCSRIASTRGAPAIATPPPPCVFPSSASLVPQPASHNVRAQPRVLQVAGVPPAQDYGHAAAMAGRSSELLPRPSQFHATSLSTSITISFTVPCQVRNTAFPGATAARVPSPLGCRLLAAGARGQGAVGGLQPIRDHQ